jgi:hypothetical protein
MSDKEIEDLPGYEELSAERRRLLKLKIRQHQDRYQTATVRDAHYRNQHWLREEDIELVSSPLTHQELAIVLGRTYYGITSRLGVLARLKKLGLEPPYEYEQSFSQPIKTIRNDKSILCPCATIDDDHSDWCPAL